MIQFASRTYRIVEVGHSTYRAVRIADEITIGEFRCAPQLQLGASSVSASELSDVARAAVRAGKTRWQGDPIKRPTLRAYATIVLAMMLGLASCSGSPPPPARTGAATANAAAQPPDTNTATALSAEAQALPDMPPPDASLDRVMRAHFHDALLVRRAIIAGAREQAVAPAQVLAVAENEETVPASWREFVRRLQAAARRISTAASAEQAASATADLALSCGECHGKLGGPRASSEPPPPPGTTIGAWMKRHQWASERLWEGLVVPSSEAWDAGVQALGASGFPPRVLGSDGSQARRAAADLSNVVTQAPRATDAQRRAGLYAQLLVSCGNCHRAVKQRRTE